MEDEARGSAPRTSAALVATLGVVFGDIGTSPLYAIRECFVGTADFAVDQANVFGVLSLITWALVMIVSVKYVGLVLRADHQGEGGILALANLLVPSDTSQWTRTHLALVAIGLFGAALLFGDGIITPALSVLSAVEGLAVAAPGLQGLVVPVALAILLGLFAVQRFGTGRVGRVFGPVMLLWFGALGLLGVGRIAEHPQVLVALDPRHAIAFFGLHGLHGTVILGSVFLAVTGAEAMYADLGHFGRAPITRAWFALVFPALLLNYFGQGALLLQHPEWVEELFYRMAPAWGLVPLVGLATLATVIASQAVISGVFSLTSQAIQLEYLPRMQVLHTASAHRGQIYVPTANRFLMVGTLLLVLGFRSSGSLADAYGIAVSVTMVLTTVLMGFAMVRVWRWPWLLAASVGALLFAVDLPFALSIARKVGSGGWVPLSLATGLFLLMMVWRRGRVRTAHVELRLDDDMLATIEGPVAILVQYPEHLPEVSAQRKDVLFLHVEQCGRPYMTRSPHFEQVATDHPPLLRARFGFMEQPDLNAVLADVERVDPSGVPWSKATFVLLRVPSVPKDEPAGLLERAYGCVEVLARPIAPSLGVAPERTLELVARSAHEPRT